VVQCFYLNLTLECNYEPWLCSMWWLCSVERNRLLQNRC